MQMQRTTIRFYRNLKKEAERRAVERDTTFQSIVNDALRLYLRTDTKKQAKQLVFRTHDIGVGLDGLTREDYYDDPQTATSKVILS